MIARTLCSVVFCLGAVGLAGAQVPESAASAVATTEEASEPVVFSGPQVGEAMPPFLLQGVFDDIAGERIDPVQQAGSGGLLVVFVHKATRPSIALTRMVANFASREAAQRANAAKGEVQPLEVAVCFLSRDRTETTAFLKRARHALPDDVTLGISIDGIEGPGTYGLDRNMTLTVLVANNGVVTDNFALVQPGVAADGPNIGQAILRLLGEDRMPALAELQAVPDRAANERVDDGTFRALLGPVIRKDAEEADVEAAAKAVEAHAEQHPAFRQRLREVAKRIIDAGRLEQYGTPRAQQYLQKWSTLKVASEKMTSEKMSAEAERQP